jgi:hypothetical protein
MLWLKILNIKGFKQYSPSKNMVWWFGLWCLTHFKQYFSYVVGVNQGNNKITELGAIFQKERQNS